MTQVILRVHPVHLMNVGQRQMAADPQTKPTDLGCESTCTLLLSTSTIVIYYYSAWKMILILPSQSLGPEQQLVALMYCNAFITKWNI